MKSTINKILDEIAIKKEELKTEYEKLKEKYNFSVEDGKVSFSEQQKERFREKKKSISNTILGARLREILSIPFIYGMTIPAIILDIAIFIYQNTALRLYKVPLVDRSDYIKMDRNELEYLNFIEKINCLYCSYFNGLLAYAVEVAGRTERYWCPIKYASNKMGGHEWERFFADFGDADGFREAFKNRADFEEMMEKIDNTRAKKEFFEEKMRREVEEKIAEK